MRSTPPDALLCGGSEECAGSSGRFFRVVEKSLCSPSQASMAELVQPERLAYCEATTFSMIKTKCCCGCVPGTGVTAKFICFAASTAA